MRTHPETHEIHQTADQSIQSAALVCEVFHMELSLYISRVHFQSCYKESWTKIRDGGYKLRLDAIPFQSAKASAEILSDVSLQLLLVIISCNLTVGLKNICLCNNIKQLNPVYIMVLTADHLYVHDVIHV